MVTDQAILFFRTEPSSNSHTIKSHHTSKTPQKGQNQATPNFFFDQDGATPHTTESNPTSTKRRVGEDSQHKTPKILLIRHTQPRIFGDTPNQESIKETQKHQTNPKIQLRTTEQHHQKNNRKYLFKPR